jgi:hypothetical protein
MFDAFRVQATRHAELVAIDALLAAAAPAGAVGGAAAAEPSDACEGTDAAASVWSARCGGVETKPTAGTEGIASIGNAVKPGVTYADLWGATL